jgi:hypothetical protein
MSTSLEGVLSAKLYVPLPVTAVLTVKVTTSPSITGKSLLSRTGPSIAGRAL